MSVQNGSSRLSRALLLGGTSEIGLAMRFGVYQPPQAKEGKVPVLIFLAGLTCNEETFAIKAGAQRFAAQHGVMLVTPDTSPRGVDIPGADAEWDFGIGAGFYIDATQSETTIVLRSPGRASQARLLAMNQKPSQMWLLRAQYFCTS